MLPLRVYTIALDSPAGAHLWLDLDGVRAVGAGFRLTSGSADQEIENVQPPANATDDEVAEIEKKKAEGRTARDAVRKTWEEIERMPERVRERLRARLRELREKSRRR